MTEVHGADLAAELGDLRRLVAAQSVRIAELEAHTAPQASPEERSTRRGMLRLAGAAVVGGAAASLVGAQPAAAVPAAMFYGASNDAGLDGTSLISAVGGSTLFVINTAGITALQGDAAFGGIGVHGRVINPSLTTSYGVWGEIAGTAGIALIGTGGAAQLRLDPISAVGAPSSGSHLRGEFVARTDGVYYCTTQGTPGTWRKLAGTATAGTFHAITPTRVYDSRAPAPIPGMLFTGSNRTISVADERNSSGAVTTVDLVPAGATAVMANITVTGTTGVFGYLAINPGGDFVEGASTINWFGPGQTLANGVGLTLNSTRQLSILCRGGGATHFIVDIAGYYL